MMQVTERSAQAEEPAGEELLVRPGASIMEAVGRAAPGQTIRLAPGLYREQVVLEKEVHIVGPREAVLEWDADVTLHCKGPAGPSVRGITVRNAASRQNVDVECPEFTAVRIAGGSWAVIQDCDVSCQCPTWLPGVSAIKVLEAGTEPVLRSNAVRGARAGLLFGASAKGIVEGNEVFGESGAGMDVGIGIADRADPVVRDNKVHGCKVAGICTSDEGRGTMEGNDVFGNGLAGIFITGGGAVVCGNKVHDGDGYGIVVAAEQEGTDERGTLVEGNDIFRNGLAASHDEMGDPIVGVLIADGADPVVCGNKIHDQERGIYVSKGGKGTITGNTLERLGTEPEEAISVEPDCTGCRVKVNTVAGRSVDGGRLWPALLSLLLLHCFRPPRRPRRGGGRLRGSAEGLLAARLPEAALPLCPGRCAVVPADFSCY